MALDLVLFGVIILVLLVVIYYYNSIVVLSNRLDNAWSQIDVQLKKRADLIPNLIETVKGYMKHERGVLTEVTHARAAIMNAKDVPSKLKAGDMLTGALKSLFAVSENYPQLRATENFKMLQEEMSGIENKIAYARQFYNDSVLTYNNMVTLIPGVIFANLFGKKVKPYLEASAAERQNVQVKF